MYLIWLVLQIGTRGTGAICLRFKNWPNKQDMIDVQILRTFVVVSMACYLLYGIADSMKLLLFAFDVCHNCLTRVVFGNFVKK